MPRTSPPERSLGPSSQSGTVGAPQNPGSCPEAAVGSVALDAAATDVDLDRPMTLAEFARWLGVEEGWVRRRLRLLPGVIIESREMVRVHARTYLETRLRRSPKIPPPSIRSRPHAG